VRVVIDTNVLISGLFWTGTPKQILNKARHGQIIFVTSESLLEELERILTRDDKPFKLSNTEVSRVISSLREWAEVVQTDTRVSVCRDEGDNKVLECAIDGKAQQVITGDQHLLELQSFQGIRILSAADFLDELDEIG
jgi:putative PIN family toxin of toxin-antitoxin system